jgi:glycosyltransferase involved in cell wall biosynthesis
VPPGLSSHSNLILHPSLLPTWKPAMRIFWEQLLWPALLAQHRAVVAHGPAHALPIGWRGRSVVTIHDLSFLVNPRTFRSMNQRYLRTMVRMSVRRATRIIAVSESTKQDVIRFLGAAPEVIDVVHEGVDARFRRLDSSQTAQFRAQHGLPERFILFLGTLEPRKNLNRLLEAYAGLRGRGSAQWPLVIAGGMGPGGEAVRAHCEALGLANEVRFVGFVPEDEKPLWYNSAHLFVFPSQYEGFGLPVLEALACGTPVVTSNSSSLPEVVGDAGLQVDPIDVIGLTEAIQRVMVDEELHHQLAAAGIERASGFSWSAAAEHTVRVYRSALGEQ